MENFVNGISFIPLAPISDPDLVIPTIAQAFGIKEVVGRSFLNLLKTFLYDKQALLYEARAEEDLSCKESLGSSSISDVGGRKSCSS